MLPLPILRLCLTMMVVSAVALCCDGCSTSRTIQVVDAQGLIVTSAVVVFLEENMAWKNKVGAGFVDRSGTFNFKALNLVSVEAFDGNAQWGRLSLKSQTTGTVVLLRRPYTGYNLGFYLTNTPNANISIRERLEMYR